MAAWALAGCQAGTTDTGSGAGAGQPSSSASFGQGGSTGTFADGGASACQNHCSADLHDFVDCDGNVLVACPDDQGCAPDGTCVDACESAKLNQSTIGCDFFSVTPPVVWGSRGGCFAAMIANTWTSPITVGLEYAGQTLDAAAFTFVAQGQGGSLTYQPLSDGTLHPGELGIVMLSEYQSGDIFQVDCPKPPALEQATQIDTTGKLSAFRIATSAPVVAYDVYPWGGATSYATSAALLTPTPSWGTNFVTADGWTAENGQPFTQIVAAEDGTNVTLVPRVGVAGGGGLPAIAANTPATFTLNRGEVAQFLQNDRLAGSILQADKPVGVWGGSSCMNIPAGTGACDAAHQQLLSVQTLGNEYVGARYPSRGGDDSAPYTVVGLVDGTSLVFDPSPAGAPAALDRGDVAIFYTDKPFHVTSQDADHPFYVAAHMTGGDTNGNGLGDPEYVNVVPPAQYLSKYLFVTDPTYQDTALVFTRKKDGDGAFHDVSLDCMGPLSGWQPIGGGDTEVLQVMMVLDGQGQNGCNNGVHTAESAAAFGLTVWGYDYYASYAYPAGMSVEPINTVVVPPIPQ